MRACWALVVNPWRCLLPCTYTSVLVCPSQSASVSCQAVMSYSSGLLRTAHASPCATVWTVVLRYARLRAPGEGWQPHNRPARCPAPRSQSRCRRRAQRRPRCRPRAPARRTQSCRTPTSPAPRPRPRGSTRAGTPRMRLRSPQRQRQCDTLCWLTLCVKHKPVRPLRALQVSSPCTPGHTQCDRLDPAPRRVSSQPCLLGEPSNAARPKHIRLAKTERKAATHRANAGTQRTSTSAEAGCFIRAGRRHEAHRGQHLGRPRAPWAPAARHRQAPAPGTRVARPPTPHRPRSRARRPPARPPHRPAGAPPRARSAHMPGPTARTASGRHTPGCPGCGACTPRPSTGDGAPADGRAPLPARWQAGGCPQRGGPAAPRPLPHRAGAAQAPAQALPPNPT